MIYRPSLLAIILAIIFITFGGVVWAINLTNAPLVPSELVQTPTAYAIQASARATATAEAAPEPSTLVLEASTLGDLAIHRCPGNVYNTGRIIPEGELIDVFGWSLDIEANIWVLVKDDINEPQEWVLLDNQIEVRPTNWRSLYPEDVPCRP